MDFRNRGGRPAHTMSQTVSPGGSVSAEGDDGGGRKKRGVKTIINPLNLILLFCVAIVLLGVTWLAIFIKEPDESKFVDEKKLQAIFLDGGQVYFGSITELNDEFLRVHNIYYLRVNQQVQPEQEGQPAQQDISLVKLGCELHGPQDLMIINRQKVIFWENLKDDGQVTQAVKKYIEANPEGQDCSAQADNSNGNNATPAAEDN